MSRITPVPDDAKGDHEPLFEQSRERWGTVPSFYRALAHSPEALRHIMSLTVALRSQWRADTSRMRLMQLAILTPSLINDCEIWTNHNVKLGQAAGLNEEHISLIVDGWEDSDLFDEREKAVIRWATALTRNTAAADDACFAPLKSFFSEKDIVELTLFTCLFNAWNRLQDGLHNPVEPPDDIIGWKEWEEVAQVSG